MLSFAYWQHLSIADWQDFEHSQHVVLVLTEVDDAERKLGDIGKSQD
jgi:hypothetical protein